MKIKAEPISSVNFKKFGKVVTPPKADPTSMTVDYKFWSDIASYTINGDTEIGICTVFKQPKNEIIGMERHLRTPEILIPIDGPFILPLLKEGERDELAEAFKVNVGEVVVIDDGIWHGACLPVTDNQSSYFVIFRKGTPAEDVQKKKVGKINIII